MNQKSGHKFRILMLIALMLSAAALFAACGSGGGSGSLTGSVSDATLFITDDLSNDYQQVMVTVFKVVFEKPQDKSPVTAFEDPLGVTYDITELDGILSKLGTLPPGNYSNVFITVGEELMLVDNMGNQLNPTFAQNAWTTCSGSQCVIRVPGAANVVDNQHVILDFDLKQFRYDQATNTVTAKIVLDADGSDHKDYDQEDDEDYKVKGVIQNMPMNNEFELMVIKAKHFMPPSNIITVRVDDNTRYGCDDDHAGCTLNDFSDLMQWMKIEIKGNWNAADEVFDATKIEVDEADD